MTPAAEPRRREAFESDEGGALRIVIRMEKTQNIVLTESAKGGCIGTGIGKSHRIEAVLLEWFSG